MIRFGPSGNSLSFYEAGFKHTYEAAAWLEKRGLNAYEYSFGRGVHLGADTAREIGRAMTDHGVAISVHAPYYINFATPEPDKAAASVGYVMDSLAALALLGGDRCVVHVAAQGKATRAEAMARACERLQSLALLVGAEYPHMKLCLETMGKHGQMGTPQEIADMCRLSTQFYP
ncbi:MAG: TIM barrel protein, partial [Clostridiales bacterium]|nr:TIM barrel protein [Clostridiales bacterium]